MPLAVTMDCNFWRRSLRVFQDRFGAVSVYGLGRFPVTLYYEQWTWLLARSDELRTFLEENKGKLKLKSGGGE